MKLPLLLNSRPCGGEATLQLEPAGMPSLPDTLPVLGWPDCTASTSLTGAGRTTTAMLAVAQLLAAAVSQIW
ncbi:hypothetical protein D3C71_1045600 [compost metagenome]